jgi:hypothetical protein
MFLKAMRNFVEILLANATDEAFGLKANNKKHINSNFKKR